ncbi:hypothetical protein HDU97_005078 [Phlyctochytrium planicorne]|nr:hypothetical protein HDU97_005078 [Phlyctochytrium planicorne]
MNTENLIPHHVRDFISVRHEAHIDGFGDHSVAGALISTSDKLLKLARKIQLKRLSEKEVDVSEWKKDRRNRSNSTWSRYPAAPSTLLQAATLSEFPYCFTVKDGLVAIIDISGFTRLTNILEKYSDSGGALIRDLLNKPFKKIIERVHAHQGSIVKFAGDAIIAVWSRSLKSPEEEKSTKRLILRATLCCLELLFVFRNYKLNLPNSEDVTRSVTALDADRSDQGKSTRADNSNSGPRPSVNSRLPQNVLKKTPFAAQTPQVPNRTTPSASTSESPASQYQLQIHIGLASGEVSHVQVGELQTSSAENIHSEYQSSSMPPISDILLNGKSVLRREYFVVGEAAEVAGKLLGLGKEGEMVICMKTKEGVETTLKESIGEIGRTTSKYSENAAGGSMKGFVLTASTSTEDKMKEILKSLRQHEDQQVDGEGQLHRLWDSSLYDSIYPYIDESLSKFFQDRRALSERRKNIQMTSSQTALQPLTYPLNRNEALGSHSTLTGMGGSNSSINQDSVTTEYNQVRVATVVFLRLLDYNVREGASPTYLTIAQKVMTATMAAVRMFGGCLRQFNCDDKAASLLMVWGLEGFAHERGEPIYAISAALMLAKQLQIFLGDEFAIGVCTGKVFSGMIGNSERADGTVLGSCVNLAARFMCDPGCKGKILCDEHSYKESKDDIIFNEPISLLVKGALQPVKAYTPLKKVATNYNTTQAIESNQIFGRVAELKITQELLERFMKGEESIRLLITGPSGTGKSTILDHFRKEANNENIIVCHSLGSENFRYVLFYGFYGIILDLFKTLQTRIGDIQIHRTRSQAASLLDRNESTMDRSVHSYDPLFINNVNNSVAYNVTLQDGSKVDFSEILRAFGEPRESAHMIETLFPFLQGDQKIALQKANNQSNNITRFTKLLLRILNELSRMNIKICLLFDDIQWVDAKSLNLVTEIMRSCPNVLIGISSRPLEEYSKELAEHFEPILKDESMVHIELKHFSKEETEELIRGEISSHAEGFGTLSPELVRDIFERSQGVPFAIKVLAQSMIQSFESPTVEQHVPKDALTAVIAQFDRLEADVKTILRVGAIAGQAFSTTDVYAILKRGRFDMQTPIETPLDISKILISSDRYHFVSKSPTPTTSITFTHYLIQQGILSTIIPKRKELLHRLFADHYERTLTSNNSTTQLMLLVRHLLRLPNERNRKLKYTQIAFQEAAEQCMPVEGFMLYNIFENLLKEFGVANELTPLQKARHKKLLGLLHFESGNFNQASTQILAAMQDLGLHMPNPKSEPLRFVRLSIEAAMIQFKMFNRPIPDQIRISRKWAQKIAPLAFKKLNAFDLRKSPTTATHTNSHASQTAFPTVTKTQPYEEGGGEQEEDCLSFLDLYRSTDAPTLPLPSAPPDEEEEDSHPFGSIEKLTFNEASRQVLDVFDIAVRILYQQPGKLLILCGLIELNVSPTFIPYPKETASRALTRVGSAMYALGFVEMGERFRQSAITLVDEINHPSSHALDERGKLSLAHTYEFQAVISLFKVDAHGYVTWLGKCVEILDSIGYEDAEFTYIHRIAMACVNAWAIGELNLSCDVLETEYEKRKLMDRNNVVLRELELCLASIAALGYRTEDMSQYYEQATLVGGTWRQTKIVKMTLQIEVYMICKNVLLTCDEDPNPWRQKATRTVKDFEIASLKLDPVVLPQKQPKTLETRSTQQNTPLPLLPTHSQIPPKPPIHAHKGSHRSSSKRSQSSRGHDHSPASVQGTVDSKVDPDGEFGKEGYGEQRVEIKFKPKVDEDEVGQGG